jgi:AcrR family transcriptional regulator
MIVTAPEAAKPLYRLPKQARGKATCAAIFEATARILELQGPSRLNTNLIADTAGVSIGTLYQYFPNKQAILIAMAHAEGISWGRNAKAAIAQGLDRDRAVIRTMIQAFPGRPRTRRAAVKAQLDAEPAEGLRPRIVGDGRDTMDDFIVDRAIVGVVRAAVFEDAPFLHTAAFEEALVRLAQSCRARRAQGVLGSTAGAP